MQDKQKSFQQAEHMYYVHKLIQYVLLQSTIKTFRTSEALCSLADDEEVREILDQWQAHPIGWQGKPEQYNDNGI